MVDNIQVFNLATFTEVLHPREDGERLHIVSLSGGVSSAITAERVIERYGREHVVLWFADTNWEDPDLHRFMADCMERWGGQLLIYKDGRNPLQVAEEHNIIPNQRVAPCTRELKIEPFYEYISIVPKPITVYLGLDWREVDRMEAPRRNYEAMEGVTVEYPLAWEPIEERNYFDMVEQDWGIRCPQLYAEGFTHNNCGGRCVKQGQSSWLRLRKYRPADFAVVRDWEDQQRKAGGNKANYAILRDQRGGKVRPLTLIELESRQDDVPIESVRGDSVSCFCSYG